MKEILKLIETVSPDDTAKLDEIDARVWCWLNNRTFKGMLKNKYEGKQPNRFACYNEDGDIYRPLIVKSRQYTRSRDSLKAIRPEGYYLFGSGHHARGSDETGFLYSLQKDKNVFGGLLGKTEELAELHAIIQAIEYERNENL